MSGCGYIGDPRPPLANVPANVQDLSATQRGAAIAVQFHVPPRTTENAPIREPLKLDLRIGTYGSPFNAEGWAAQAKQIAGGKIENGMARYEIPSGDWTGKAAIVAVRAIGANGKAANWSNFVVVPVVPPPETPRAVRAAATPQGMRISWTARGANFRVFRRAGDETGFTVVANVDRPEWTDPATEFGKRYVYRVETVVKLEAGKEAESEFSEEAAITPANEFPPAAPAGLRAVAALNSIELNWEANAEPFLGGYRVYRSTGGGPFEKIADIGPTPAYSDRTAEPGKTYRYAVSAVSKTGHESPRSEAVETGIP
ncbi:MAG: hypothetical protein ABSC23_19645 [Bryobacteraceae bacterium]